MATSPARKGPAQTPAADSTVPNGGLVRQPNGGAIRRGSKPGNTPGSGRPPSILREIARQALGEAIPQLRLVALGERVTVTRKLDRKGDDGEPIYADVAVRSEVRERMEAFDRLTALGMGEEIRSEDVRKRLERQNEIILATLAPEDADRVLAAIAEAWQ